MIRAVVLLLLVFGPRAVATDVDVCVYGGTASGVAAAIQAARMVKSVVLIEPSQHIGGMTSGGLGWTDSGDKAAVGGIAREFYQRVKKHYDKPESWKYGKRDDYKSYRPADDAMWTFEPHVAEQILREMLAEAKVQVVRAGKSIATEQVDQTVVKVLTWEHSGSSVVWSSFHAKVFIDATYEGDLMKAAHIGYTVGREPNSKYSEKLNGVQRA